MDITYKVNQAISTDDFIGLLKASTLAERRPVNDHACMKGMIKNSNLTITAWDEEKLIGIARSMTDYYYAGMTPIVKKNALTPSLFFRATF